MITSSSITSILGQVVQFIGIAAPAYVRGQTQFKTKAVSKSNVFYNQGVSGMTLSCYVVSLNHSSYAVQEENLLLRISIICSRTLFESFFGSP